MDPLAQCGYVLLVSVKDLSLKLCFPVSTRKTRVLFSYSCFDEETKNAQG